MQLFGTDLYLYSWRCMNHRISFVHIQHSFAKGQWLQISCGLYNWWLICLYYRLSLIISGADIIFFFGLYVVCVCVFVYVSDDQAWKIDIERDREREKRNVEFFRMIRKKELLSVGIVRAINKLLFWQYNILHHFYSKLIANDEKCCTRLSHYETNRSFLSTC